MQEMIIPMTVMKIKSGDEGLFVMDPIEGPGEAVEGREIVFTTRIQPAPGKFKRSDEPRVDVETAYGKGGEQNTLPDQIVYMTSKGETITSAFKPKTESATIEDRRRGMMKMTLSIKAVCHRGGKAHWKKRTVEFTVKLNSDKIIRRVPAHLGNILGLTPRSMR